jgi:hypothetical protein
VKQQKPAPVADRPKLPFARQKLEDTISDLIDPRPEYHDGKMHWLNPRYHELREALTSRPAGARTKSGPQPPGWIDAIDLLTKIDHRIHELAADYVVSECDDLAAVQRLRYLVARKWAPEQVEDVETITSDLAGYVEDIDRLFAPAPKYLPDKCPHCGHDKAARTVDGQTIRMPALQITDDGCTCNNCQDHWPPDRLVFLGRVLGYRIEGVLDVQEVS